jgi:hypothetical protein
VVISAGFREIGGEGARRERELLAVCFTRHLRPEDRRGMAVARENIERHCDLRALLEVLQP